MLLNTHPMKFATAEGFSFSGVAKSDLPTLVRFLAEHVLIHDEDHGAQPVPIGLAAELRSQHDEVVDPIGRRVLALISQNFLAAHKLPLVSDTERGEASTIVCDPSVAKLHPDAQRELYELVARALIGIGHKPATIFVPEHRPLEADEILELFVSHRIGAPVEEVNELVARFQAFQNPLVDYLFRSWKVIVDRDYTSTPTWAESRVLHERSLTPPSVGIVFESADIVQTAESAAEPDSQAKDVSKSDDKLKTADKPKTNVRRKRVRKTAPLGLPKARLSSGIVTFLGSQFRCKTSLILDLVQRRLAGDPSAASIHPGQHPLAFAKRHWGKEVPRTKHNPGFDFEVATDFPLFGGRNGLSLTIKDIDGEEYQPAQFGQAQCQNVQGSDALIVALDPEAMQPGAEQKAAEDALFLARLLGQHRYRSGLPIAIVVPAVDMLMSEEELAAIVGCRLLPAKFDREILTGLATRCVGRLAESTTERLHRATFQNPGVARSLNVLRIVEILFHRYAPVFSEAVALTGDVEIFFTSTSTTKSGWTRTYGSVEVVKWIAGTLEQQIRPVLSDMQDRELSRLVGQRNRVGELLERIRRLDGRREKVQKSREANTTATFVLPWNKPTRLQAQDKQAEDATISLVAELETTLGIKTNARATVPTRRRAIASASAELANRIHALNGI